MAKRTIPPELRSAQAFSSRNSSQPKASRQTVRQLKVRESYYDYQYHTPNRSRPYRPPVPVPWVQIKGYWLNQAGFTIGTALSVQVQKGRIVLTPESSTE